MQLVHKHLYLLAAIGISLIYGCSTEPVVLSFQDEPVKKSSPMESDRVPPNKNSLQQMNCDVVIDELSDSRDDKTSLGNLGYREVKSDELLSWIESVFRERDYLFYSDSQSHTHIHLALKLAHIRSSDTAKATNIVLSVKNPDSEETRYFRGRDAGVNWSGDHDEIKNSFIRALNDSIRKMESELFDCT